MQAHYADGRSAHYRRSFVLSDERETDKTEVSIKDRVLTVRIHKRAEMRTTSSPADWMSAVIGGGR